MKLLEPSHHYCAEELKEGTELGPHCAERFQSLEQRIKKFPDRSLDEYCIIFILVTFIFKQIIG